MDAALRGLSDEVDLATQRLLDDARTLTEDDLRGPSRLPGWTRAHVLAHLARGADAMRNVLAGARLGEDRPGYASAQARDDAIEAGAALSAADLMADLAESAMALRALSRLLPESAWQAPVRAGGAVPFPAAGLITRRLAEVELHHCDLATGYGPDRWAAAFTTLELDEPLRSQRQERIGRRPGAEPESRSRPRPPASWRPGQPLPGSWIGRGQS
jgi:maleylpyruvate isomerase